MRKKRREDLLPETRFHLARTQILLFAALTGFNLLLFTLFPGIRRLFASEFPLRQQLDGGECLL